MPTNFVLTLDTTAPDAAILIAAGAAFASSRDTTVVVTSAAADATQMKIWGDVDNAFDANVQTTEAASAWITFDHAAKAIRLLAGDGLKTINVRVRDDVGNASAPASDTITLDTTAPALNITVAAAPTKISKVAGFDTSTFTFQSDSDLQAWEVRVVPASGSDHTTGTVIPTAAGSANTSGGALGAGVGKVVTIKGTDLEAASAGDGGKVVKVFGQDLSGLWSL
jgi:hypothetical protein